ncbi:MAG TPA: hypothetical protein VG873_02775 [Burkholderiales bacterium]|nr:hypothetical protein [Burkholderiales bacterium]
MSDSIGIRVLRTAARMQGSPARLRDALQVTSAEVADWLAGTQEPPEDVVLRALALILDGLDAHD